MESFEKYLGNMNELTASSSDGKNDYVHPALKNTGSVSIVLIREVIAPTVFKNAEQEITDIEFCGQTYVRAVANKFKYQERNRGMQILRSYGVGGRMPQNRTFLKAKQNPSEAFDLNTLVFGDSTTQESRVLPVKAAVNYSDGLSLLPYHLCVDESFHNRAMEDGTLFDAVNKKNSDNLFTRHFILPGVLLIQVLTTRGRTLPVEGIDHLLLCLGLAGAYGGQTSVSGTNIQTHFAGMYGGAFERPETSPYELVQHLNKQLGEEDLSNSKRVCMAIHKHLTPLHQEAVDGEVLSAQLNTLVQQFEDDSRELRDSYQQSAKKVGDLFDAWFENKKKRK